MIRAFVGDTADSVWSSAALAFRDDDVCSQASRAGTVREILTATLTVNFPAQRWILSRIPSINPAFALAEVIWILRGRNDSKFLNFFNSKLPDYAGDSSTYHGAYGFRLRRSLGVDQLQRAYSILSQNPDSRQVVLQIWDSRLDLPNDLGQSSNPDIPCNVVSLLNVRNGRLEWTQIIRSNDLHLGVPYNIVQFTSLQEILAGWLGCEMGSFNVLSNSLHVYEKSIDYVRQVKPIVPIFNPDSLFLPKVESDRVFSELSQIADSIRNPNLEASSLVRIAIDANLPSAYFNIASVLCAEAARRRRLESISQEIMSHCSNPVYNHMFSRWADQCKVNRLAQNLDS